MKFPAFVPFSRIAVPALLAGCAAAVQAAPPVPCRVEPFTDAGGADYEALLARRCGGDRVNWQVETPRAKPTDVGPSQVRSRVDTSTTERLGESFQTSLRVSWAGLRTETAPGLRTEQATVAAGAQLRLADSWALKMNLGRDVAGVPRNRATLSSVWQPLPSGTLYAEWIGNGLMTRETEVNRVGARWWLVPRRVAFDLGTVQRPGVPGWEDPRFGLTWDISNLLR